MTFAPISDTDRTFRIVPVKNAVGMEKCRMQPTLIVNADDFGLTRGVNAAISECVDAEVLRSATIMANGRAFDDAVRTARDLPGLGVGIHFVLTGLPPVSPAARLPELTGDTGRLPPGLGGLLRLSLTSKTVHREIRSELFAQAERVFDSGIRVTHFDSHKHVHMIPQVLDVLVEMATRFSIRWIRRPFEAAGSLRLLPHAGKGQWGPFLKQYGKALACRCSLGAFHSRIRAAGLRTPERVFGVCTTGFLNENMIRSICGMLRPGVNELMTHPGRLDADLKNSKTRLLLSREIERDLLVSRTVKELFRKNNVVLGNFGKVSQ